MADETRAFPLRNGHYKATGNWYSFIVVNGSTGILKEPSNSKIETKIKLGEFGEADPEIVETTGQQFYNIEFTYTIGSDYKEPGVLSEDGLKITTKGMMGVTVLEWVTQEEAAALEAEGDPIEAPPGEYKIQPEYQGKFLWITGQPGLGKSTCAQLLCKEYGYVYYEGDCFGSCRNPYIPGTVPDPSIARSNQKPLKGDGLDERMAICKKATEAFMDMLKGEAFKTEIMTDFFTAMCDDILNERQRIGGDWAVAAVAMTREMRDHIRSRLGPDLVFVVLDMEKEEVRKRVKARHHGEEQAVEMMEPIAKLCEPIGDDEENAVGVIVTTEMTREEVINKILEAVN